MFAIPNKYKVLSWSNFLRNLAIVIIVFPLGGLVDVALSVRHSSDWEFVDMASPVWRCRLSLNEETLSEKTMKASGNFERRALSTNSCQMKPVIFKNHFLVFSKKNGKGGNRNERRRWFHRRLRLKRWQRSWRSERMKYASALCQNWDEGKKNHEKVKC